MLRKKLAAIEEQKSSSSGRRRSVPPEVIYEDSRQAVSQHQKQPPRRSLGTIGGASSSKGEAVPHPPDPSKLPVTRPVSSQLLFFTSRPLKQVKPQEEQFNAVEDLRSNKEFIAALRERVSVASGDKVSSERVAQDLPPIDVSTAILEQALHQEPNVASSACITNPSITSMEVTLNISCTSPANPATSAGSTGGATVPRDASSEPNVLSPASSTTDSGTTVSVECEVALIAETDKYLMVGRKPELAISAPDCTCEVYDAWDTSAVVHFFSNSTCYDLMPIHSRVVVLDSQLPIGKAFSALLQNGLRAAPLWSSQLSRYSGMVTVSDLMHIFLHYHDLEATQEEEGQDCITKPITSPQCQENEPAKCGSASAPVTVPCSATEDSLSEYHLDTNNMAPRPPWPQHRLSRDILLERGTIDYWMKRLYGSRGAASSRTLWTLTPRHCLLSAINLLREKHVHRLAVVNPRTGNLHFIMTHQRLLAYLYMRLPLLLQAADAPALWHRSLHHCSAFIGTWGSALATVTPSTLLVDALRIMLTRRVSTLPVLTQPGGPLVDLLTKWDFMFIGSTSDFKRVNLTLQEVLTLRNRHVAGSSTGDNAQQKANVNVRTCESTASVVQVLSSMAHYKVNRIIIVESNESQCVQGIVTASDLLHALTIHPQQQHPQHVDRRR